MEINYPVSLTNFKYCEGVFFSNIPTWKIVQDDTLHRIEFKANDIFNSDLIMVLSALITACIFLISIGYFYSGNNDNIDTFLIVGGSILAILFCIILPVGYSLVIYNTTNFFGRSRFCYNTSTKSLYFGKDDVLYERNSYNQIILGVTIGYNVCDKWDYEIMPALYQFYILVCDNNNLWHRHLIATDMVRSTIDSAIKTILKIEHFSVIRKAMTFEECLSLSRSSDQ
jgi:hypothetical protein